MGNSIKEGWMSGKVMAGNPTLCREVEDQVQEMRWCVWWIGAGAYQLVCLLKEELCRMESKFTNKRIMRQKSFPKTFLIRGDENNAIT